MMDLLAQLRSEPSWAALVELARTQPLLALVVMLIVLLSILRAIAWQSQLRSVMMTVFGANPRADTVILIVPGFRGSPRRMRDVVRLTQDSYPGAELRVARFAGGLYSNVTAHAIADKIDTDMRERCGGPDSAVKRVIVIGYSLGGLIARKAFVWGKGGHFEDDRPVKYGESQWTRKVERIVLIAGMNRGWTVSAADDGESRARPGLVLRSGAVLGKLLGRLSRSGKLMLGAERGSPFVADLRIQWIDLVRGNPSVRNAAGQPLRAQQVPPVIQLLGTVDGVVSIADNADVTASKDFIFLPLQNCNHAQAIELAPTWKRWQKERRTHVRKQFEAAITRPPDELKRTSVGVDASAEETSVAEVIFVMHGIRDVGFWTADIQREFDRMADNVTRRIVRAGYGRFPMGAFLVLGSRQRYVRWFMDRYTEVRARYPNASVSYFGHSNGTYLLASALERYRTVRVNRVLFAGSVVKTNYPWPGILANAPGRRVHLLQNIVATRDLVVGIFPRLYELIANVIGPVGGFFDLGAAGFYGFSADIGYNITFVRGAHGAALGPEQDKAKAIAGYFAAASEQDAISALAPFDETGADQPGWAKVLASLSPIVWVVLLAIVGGLGYLMVMGLHRMGLPMQWGGLAVFAFVLLLLNLV